MVGKRENESFKSSIKDLDDEEAKLKKRLNEIEEERNTITSNHHQFSDASNKQHLDIKNKLDAIAPSEFDQEKYDALIVRQEKGTTYLQTINKAKEKQETIKTSEANKDKAHKEWKEIDDKITSVNETAKALDDKIKLLDIKIASSAKEIAILKTPK